MLGLIETDLRAAYAIPVKQDRYAAVGKAKEKVMAHYFPGRPGAEIRQAAHRRRVQGTRSQDRSLEHSRHRQAHRRPRPQDRAQHRDRSRPVAAHPRIGAVHPRRNPGAGGCHARHRRGRAVDRCLAGLLQGILPAALQLPALLGRRDRPHGRHQAARNRPRQAGLARAASAAAEGGRVPLHHPSSLRDHRVERLILDGLGVRLDRWR